MKKLDLSKCDFELKTIIKISKNEQIQHLNPLKNHNNLKKLRKGEEFSEPPLYLKKINGKGWGVFTSVNIKT